MVQKLYTLNPTPTTHPEKKPKHHHELEELVLRNQSLIIPNVGMSEQTS